MKQLAERLRPKTLDEYIGQEHIVGKKPYSANLYNSLYPTSKIYY